MTVATYPGLPSAWIEVLQRRAPAAASEFLADARRYLAEDGAERVPRGREAETLKNLVFAYIEPSQHDAVIYELAVASLRSGEARPAGQLSGLAALGGAAIIGIAIARRRR